MTFDPDQARAALARAEHIRIGRAQLARQVREHRITLRAALDHECVQNAEIYRWVAHALYSSRGGKRHHGEETVLTVLDAMGVGSTRRVRALTPRRRDELCHRLRKAVPSHTTAYRQTAA